MIARQGVTPLLAVILAAVVVLHFYGILLSLPLWLIALLIMLAFRDPERDIPSIPTALVSPADGKVVSIANAHDPYLNRPCVRMIVQMHPYGVFTTRSPTEGKVLEPPNLPDNVDTPHGVWLQTDEGDDVVMVMNKGRLNNSPRCYIRFGERVGQGQRCGFVHLGGTVDIYLPENSRTMVAAGDSVRGGSDVIAKLVHA